MLIKKSSNPLVGRVVCGETMMPLDESAVEACYERNGHVCGVMYAPMEDGRPYLRFCLGYQLPPFARDGRAWAKCMWELGDDRAMHVKIDESDGEIRYIYREEDLAEKFESVIDETLSFLLGDEFREKLLGFVHSKME